MLHKWDKIYDGRETLRYGGDDTTYKKGMEFLDGYGDIEDWGCGMAYAKKFVKKSKYTGVDGSKGGADIIADLAHYTSKVDCIFMRHVLGHNLEWREILENALNSFQKRMVVIVFVPMERNDRIINSLESKRKIPVLAISRIDLEGMLKKYKWRYEVLRTHTQFWLEHIYYIEKL